MLGLTLSQLSDTYNMAALSSASFNHILELVLDGPGRLNTERTYSNCLVAPPLPL